MEFMAVAYGIKSVNVIDLGRKMNSQFTRIGEQVEFIKTNYSEEWADLIRPIQDDHKRPQETQEAKETMGSDTDQAQQAG